MDHLDFSNLSEDERVAVYGAFFAMAAADRCTATRCSTTPATPTCSA